MNPASPRPPRIPAGLLRLAARGEDRFAVLGDFDEEYAELAGKLGRAGAARWFWRQGLRSALQLFGDHLYWRTVMFKNYLKVALRNIRKQKAYAFINIAGWAVGMTVCILILLWVRQELSFDRFHPNADRIYRLTLDAYLGAPQNAPVAPTPAAPALVREYPEILAAARIADPRPAYVWNDDREFRVDRMAAADASFFRIFGFPFLAGDPATALARPYTVVLTESTARKIFGAESALGKFLKGEDGKSYAVTGVMKDVPRASHLTFDILRSFETVIAADRATAENWFAISNYAYILLDKRADPAALEAKFPAFIDKYMGSVLKSIGGSMTLKLQPIRRIHLYSNFALDIAPQGDISTVLLFSGIALLVLLIASINFINLSTARSSTRAKEVGLRKTLGADRGRLMAQFLGESVLYSLLAMALAVGLHFAGLRLFENIIGRPLDTNIIKTPWMVPAMFGLALVVGLVAGLYPAGVLSSLQAARVLKGKGRIGGGVFFRRVLVVAQFAICVALIISTLVISRQIQFVKNQRLGFNKDQVLVIPRLTPVLRQSFDSVRAELRSIPGVLEVGASSLVPGRGIARSVFFPEGFEATESQLMDRLSIDPHFLSALGIRIAAGRNFSPELATDRTDSVLINETAARRFGWSDPIGKRFVLPPGSVDDGTETRYLNVVGVVEDFHLTSLHQKLEPMILFDDLDGARFVSVRLQPSGVSGTLALIKKTWARLNPGNPFDSFFLDDVFDAQYRADERMKDVTRQFGGLAVLIGCLGLFGMASFTVERRTREIGIRKVLGSSVAGIVRMLSKETVLLVLAANAVAAPAAYFLMNLWLKGFAYRAPLSVWAFVFAALVSLGIALLTISTQSLRAARGKPAGALRYE